MLQGFRGFHGLGVVGLSGLVCKGLPRSVSCSMRLLPKPETPKALNPGALKPQA